MFKSAMSPIRWTRQLFTRSRGRKPDKESIYLNSAISSLTVPTESAPLCCQFCRQQDIPFPEASPGIDDILMPSACIACVKKLSQPRRRGGFHPLLSSSNISQIPLYRNNSQIPLHRSSPGDSKILFCIACVRILPDSKFPDGPIVESCQHEPEVCLDCIEKSIVEGLDNDLPQAIGCPQCGATMPVLDVWRFSGNETFQR